MMIINSDIIIIIIHGGVSMIIIKLGFIMMRISKML